jgi:hypothetical protein
MRKERNEAFRFVIKPLLISEKEVDDHHRCPDEMIIKVILEKAHPSQRSNQNTHAFLILLLQDFVLDTIWRL